MRATSLAVILILTAVCSTVSVAAERWPFGVKGGITWANRSDDDSEEIEIRNSTMFGAFVEIPLTSALSVQPEAFYVGKGYRFVPEPTQENFPPPETDYKLNYVDIPVLARLNMTFGASRPYIIIGPSVNILLSAEEVTGNETTDITKQFKSTDFGLVAGFGLNMKSVLLEGRYSMGMSDANESGGIKNNVIALMFGIVF